MSTHHFKINDTEIRFNKKKTVDKFCSWLSVLSEAPSIDFSAPSASALSQFKVNSDLTISVSNNNTPHTLYSLHFTFSDEKRPHHTVLLHLDDIKTAISSYIREADSTKLMINHNLFNFSEKKLKTIFVKSVLKIMKKDLQKLAGLKFELTSETVITLGLSYASNKAISTEQGPKQVIVNITYTSESNINTLVLIYVDVKDFKSALKNA